MTTAKKKAKPKAKKLTVKQVEDLKAGVQSCNKTECIEKTCNLQKSVFYCSYYDGRTLSVASAASGDAKAGKASS